MAEISVPIQRIFFKIGNRTYEISSELAAQWIELGMAKSRNEFMVRKGGVLVFDILDSIETVSCDCQIIYYRD